MKIEVIELVLIQRWLSYYYVFQAVSSRLLTPDQIRCVRLCVCQAYSCVCEFVGSRLAGTCPNFPLRLYRRLYVHLPPTHTKKQRSCVVGNVTFSVLWGAWAGKIPARSSSLNGLIAFSSIQQVVVPLMHFQSVASGTGNNTDAVYLLLPSGGRRHLPL